MGAQRPPRTIDFLLGQHGLGLLRGWGTDPEAVERHVLLMQRLVNKPTAEVLAGLPPQVAGVQEGYAELAAGYDRGNSLMAAEEPVTRQMLERLPTGITVDIGCGRGGMRNSCELVDTSSLAST